MVTSHLKAGAMIVLVLLALAFSAHPLAAQTLTPTATGTPDGIRLFTAVEMLQAVNAARQQIGHRPLVFDPYLMSYAQTAADMAANNIPATGESPVESVIGMGYGYPETIDTIFCTNSSLILDENFPETLKIVPFGTIGERAAENVYYRHIGFGMARGVGENEGLIYYQLLACYTADNRYNPSLTVTPGLPTPQAISQIIIPVRTAAPLADGRIIHEVRSGQSLWAIAIAYHTHIKDILNLNLLPTDYHSLYQGQKLLIPTLSETVTPSPAPTSLTATATDTPEPGITASPSPGQTATRVRSKTPSSQGQTSDQVLKKGIILAIVLLAGAGVVFLRWMKR
jgi:hypothetical protein